jgi:hypothetical protein
MKKLLLLIVAFASITLFTSCSKERPRQCKCTVNWVNPQYSAEGLLGSVDYWWANPGEPCSKVAYNINNEIYTVICTEQ